MSVCFGGGVQTEIDALYIGPKDLTLSITESTATPIDCQETNVCAWLFFHPLYFPFPCFSLTPSLTPLPTPAHDRCAIARLRSDALRVRAAQHQSHSASTPHRSPSSPSFRKQRGCRLTLQPSHQTLASCRRNSHPCLLRRQRLVQVAVPACANSSSHTRNTRNSKRAKISSRKSRARRL